MLTQRIFQIAAGYEDADDCDLLRNDSILKLCSGRSPDAPALSSQPTMSRLENKLTTRVLYNIGIEFIHQLRSSYASEPEVIILDYDDTNFDDGSNLRMRVVCSLNTSILTKVSQFIVF